MAQLLFSLLKTARPRQWLKNTALLASIVLGGHLFDPSLQFIVLKSIIAFCMLSSSNYIFNDIKDIRADQKHPFKKFRPIAHGDVSIPAALVAMVVLAIFGLLLSLSISLYFFFVAASFLLLQYTYTILLKHISLIDILAITVAYFLRVYAGEVATGYHISIWLSLAVFSLALFLAIGKRRSELTLLQHSHIPSTDTRSSLSHYSEQLLDAFIVISANSTFITYSYYSFLEKPVVKGLLLSNYRYFIPYITERKWMMLSIPLVLFGILRYTYLIYEGKGESPEKILTKDKTLLLTIILWGSLLLLIVYGIGGS